MNIEVLTYYQRQKEDNKDDEIFYSNPRFVYHLDKSFRNRLTSLYSEYLKPNTILLDLMSSWVSHLPENITFKKVLGHGLNKIELAANKRLDEYWVQNFNKDQILPLEDSSVDYCTLVAGWQYLQYPELISSELKRIIKPNGQLIISFSNRAFWQKSPRIWVEGSSLDRANYISAILVSQGWNVPTRIVDENTQAKLFGFFNQQNDPFYAILATNTKN
tara:strand:- start:39 stop:692 length:654 start_codon:yes stop_codon:yes gene_type:complete